MFEQKQVKLEKNFNEVWSEILPDNMNLYIS